MADDAKDEVKDNGNNGTNREIITINVGGCGVALGQTLNLQYCAERGISADGTKKDKTPYDDTISIQFDESTKGKYTARSLMIDMDPYTINNVKNMYEYRSLFNKSYLISGQHDASCNFANAFCSSGKEMIDGICNELRNMVDACDNLQGFIINHSLSGGAGSGLTSLIMERLGVDYKGKMIVNFSTMHDEAFLSHPTQVYNANQMLLFMKDLCNYSVILDNRWLYKIVERELQIKTPRFKHYNFLLNKLISSITAPSRYKINGCNLQTMETELVGPFPRLKYLTSSFWPIIPRKKGDNEKQIIYKKDIQSLTNQCTQCKNFMVGTEDFDVEEDKYLALSFNFRGKIDKDKAMEAIKWIQTEKKITFAERAKNTKPTVQFHESVPAALSEDDLIDVESQANMIGNNTWISRLFNERISRIYDLLYSQRAYVHHYVGEGMHEGEFAEGRENLGFLQNDYLDALSMKPVYFRHGRTHL